MAEPFKKSKSGLYYLERWEQEAPGLVAGFTSKADGMGKYNGLNMAFHVHDDEASVRLNRKNISNKLAFPVDDWIGCEQTHEVHIKNVSKRDAGRGALDYASAFSATDGLYTVDTGVLLTLCYADCVPLYFFDRATKRVGTAHAGWKGSVGGIGSHMIKKWVKEGSQLPHIQAAIGPSICGSCYKVDKTVISAAEKWYEPGEALPFWRSEEESDAYFISLQQLNKDILVKSGVLEENIMVTALCSSCSPDFFSHRRDDGRTGRMMGYIGWKEEDDES